MAGNNAPAPAWCCACDPIAVTQSCFLHGSYGGYFMHRLSCPAVSVQQDKPTCPDCKPVIQGGDA